MRKFSLIASILNAIAAIAAIILVLPDVVPVHYNVQGMADSWGSKWTYLLFAFLPLVITVGFEIYRRKVPESRNTAMENKLIPVLPLVFIALTWIMMPTGKEQADVRLMSGVGLLLGLLMLYLTNYSGKIQQNRHLGIRLPWTLRNETVWKKTHRLGGYTGTIGGLLMCLGSVIGMFSTAHAHVWCVGGVLAGVILTALIPAVYSAYLYYSLPKEER